MPEPGDFPDKIEENRVSAAKFSSFITKAGFSGHIVRFVQFYAGC